MKTLLLTVLFFCSTSFANQPVTEPVVVVEEPPEFKMDISFPFMTCEIDDADADFREIVFMVNALDKSTGSVTTMRNQQFNDMFVEDLKLSHPNFDFTGFKFGPVYASTNELKITKLSEEKAEIELKNLGFLVLDKQAIDLTKAKNQIQFSSVFSQSDKIVFDCSLIPGLL